MLNIIIYFFFFFEMLNNGPLPHEADYDDTKAFTVANRGHFEKSII